jgi:hypothetical protein
LLLDCSGDGVNIRPASGAFIKVKVKVKVNYVGTDIAQYPLI